MFLFISVCVKKNYICIIILIDMMIRKIVALGLFMMLSLSAMSQQDLNFALYEHNKNVFNPAVVGVSGSGIATLGYRAQWLGTEGSPSVTYFSYGNSMNDKIGIGFSFVNTSFNIEKEIDLSIDFSYKLKFSEESYLSLGIKPGYYISSIDLKSAQGTSADPLFASNDKISNMTFGLGVYFEYNDLYLSLSSPNIIKADKYKDIGGVTRIATSYVSIYSGIGYKIHLSDNLDMSPSVFYQYLDDISNSVKVSSVFSYNETVGLGFHYRTDDILGGSLVYTLSEKWKVAYAYELSTAEGLESRDSHEMLLSYTF